MDDSRQVLTQIVISEAQQKEIDARLEQLKGAVSASSVLLIERSGLLLGSCGEGSINDLSISSLIAGIFKSISALTSLLGEPEVRTFQHRGNRSTLILVLMESKDMLGVMVPPDATQESFEGPVEEAVQHLTPLLIAARESTRNTPFSFSKDAISVFLGRL
ncbi:roadblock/LC7 domain-containing protein [bacterium]|nr:roadblock/LC7 domain-containing protein [bacterium]